MLPATPIEMPIRAKIMLDIATFDPAASPNFATSTAVVCPKCLELVPVRGLAGRCVTATCPRGHWSARAWRDVS